MDESNTKRTVSPYHALETAIENIAKCLHEVLQRFEDNLGAFIMDNAKNNETTMRHLQRSIPTINDEDRVFYAGHCFNLVVTAILFGQAPQFKKDLAGASDTETFQLWRRRGSIGKAHKIIKYISRSDQRFARACIATKSSDNTKDVAGDIYKDSANAFCKLAVIDVNSTAVLASKAPEDIPNRRTATELPKRWTKTLYSTIAMISWMDNLV